MNSNLFGQHVIIKQTFWNKPENVYQGKLLNILTGTANENKISIFAVLETKVGIILVDLQIPFMHEIQIIKIKKYSYLLNFKNRWKIKCKRLMKRKKLN